MHILHLKLENKCKMREHGNMSPGYQIVRERHIIGGKCTHNTHHVSYSRPEKYICLCSRPRNMEILVQVKFRNQDHSKLRSPSLLRPLVTVPNAFFNVN